MFVLVQVCSPIAHLWSAHLDAVHLTQAVLACINLSDPQYKSGDSNPVMEALSIFRHITRIMKGQSIRRRRGDLALIIVQLSLRLLSRNNREPS